MSLVERAPAVIGCVTLAAGAALLVAPSLLTRPLGLDGHDAAVRAIGVSDLILVPGLLRGRPRWPWMLGRASANAVLAGYLHDAAAQSSSPARPKAGAAAFVVLTVIDGATGLALRRSE
jgi:hypothetical protein